MELSWIDMLKIGITIVSCISLWYFRRQIVKVITDLVIGQDSKKYDGRSVSEILQDVDATLDEVLR